MKRYEIKLVPFNASTCSLRIDPQPEEVRALLASGRALSFATVEAEDLEEVFRLAQNDDWAQRDGLDRDNNWLNDRRVVERRARVAHSLSVGDVVLDLETGKHHVVAPAGFVQVD